MATLGVGWYIWLFNTAPRGQSPAKSLLGIYIIDLRSGMAAPAGAVWVRDVLVRQMLFTVIGTIFLGGIPLLVDYGWVLFDKKRQALHDKMVKSIVVYAPKGLPEAMRATRASAGLANAPQTIRTTNSLVSEPQPIATAAPPTIVAVAPKSPQLALADDASAEAVQAPEPELPPARAIESKPRTAGGEARPIDTVASPNETVAAKPPISAPSAPLVQNTAKPIWKGKAEYMGGHPDFIKPDKSMGGAELRLDNQELGYYGNKVKLRIPVSSMVSVDLGTFQPGMFRRALANDSRVLTDVRNMLLLTFEREGIIHQAEFHIVGALTVPGESEKARQLMNAINSLKSSFFRDVGGGGVTRHTDEGQPAPNTIPGLVDQDDVTGPRQVASAADRLRELKQLLDDGVISEADFQVKKADLLKEL